MKITDIINSKKVTLSYEVFPPKKDGNFEPILSAVDELCADGPDFMSVTYGAGGSTGQNTVKVSNYVKSRGVTPLAHLTCISSGREEIRREVEELRKNSIENVLALRGDIPSEGYVPGDYRYAADLVREIREMGDFCIGAACYPDGHVDCPHKEDDITYLKEKVDSGVDFLTTQMFFDNNVMYNFLYRIRERGIVVPVIAGIMPVTKSIHAEKSVKLSGTYLPTRLKNMIDKYGDRPLAMRQAGIAFATEQIIDLIANGVHCIHIYTMNDPEVAMEIHQNISEIIR